MKPSNLPSLVGRILITLSILLACAFLSRAQGGKKPPVPPPPEKSAPAKPAPPKPVAKPAPEEHPKPEPQPQHPDHEQPQVQHPVQQHPQPQPSAQQPQQQHQGPEPQRPATGKTPLGSPGSKTITPPPVDPGTTFTPWTSPTSGGRGAKPMAANATTKTPMTPVAAAKKPSNAAASTPVVPGAAPHPGGGKTVTTPAGNKLDFGKGGHLNSVVTNKGTEAHFGPHGQVSTIKTAGGMTIVRSPAGGRHIVTEHRDARGRVESRVVSTGQNRGYAEHVVQRGGHEYMHRTYVREGRTYTTVSRGYYYHGSVYYHYVPAYYFAPAYYGWGYGPWGQPIAYTGWGWDDSPWYGSSGYYFSPYSVYPSAAFWLTDFVIAENLKAAYEAQSAANAAAANAEAAAADANAAAANADTAAANAAAANADAAAAQQSSQGGAATLTPEVKEMIAEEVKAQLATEQVAAQLAAEQAAAQNASSSDPSVPRQSIADSYRTPAALDPNRRVFIVSSDLEVSVNDQPCLLLPGDVLKRTETVPDQDNTVAVYVLKSQKFDCAAGTTPRIQVAELQEMHNHFREQMDAGLKTLADNQGKHGLPSAPAGASLHQNADGTAAPDDAAAIAAQLNQQRQEAEQAETEVQQAASASGPAGGVTRP
jgi:hypothetical protein